MPKHRHSTIKRSFAQSTSITAAWNFNLSQSADALSSVDNSGHYTYINPTILPGTGTGHPDYYQAFDDDTGRQLILGANEMVLENQNQTCSNPVGVNGFNQASTSYLTVKR